MNTKRTTALGKAMVLQQFLFCTHSIIASITTSLLGQNVSMAIGCVTICAAFLLPILFYGKFTGRKINEYFTAKKVDDRTHKAPNSVLTFIFAVCITLTAVNLFGHITELVISFLGKPEATVPTGALQYALFFLRYVLLAAIVEELLFRGVVIDAFDGAGKRTKILVTALLFALAHYSLRSFLYAFAAGVILGYFMVKTGSLLFCIAVHFTQNLTSFAFTLLGSVLSRETYKALVFTSFIITVIVVIIGITYLIFEEKKHPSVAPVTEKTPKIPHRESISAELILFTVLASVITALNF